MERINDRLLNWASILEPSTREQAERTAVMPFIHPHLALMPDAHLVLIWTTVKPMSAPDPLHELRPQRLSSGVGHE